MAIISGSRSPLIGQVAVFDGPWQPRATGTGTIQVNARARRRTIVQSINIKYGNYSCIFYHNKELIMKINGKISSWDVVLYTFFNVKRNLDILYHCNK